MMKKREFIRGLRDGFPVCLGYFSVSVAFGMTAVLSGMPLWAAVLISLTNLTSAGQFAGTNLLIAGGTMAELAVTTLIINIRYFLMSLSVSQKVERQMSIPKRLAVSFGITDEIFAVSSAQHPGALTGAYMAGLILTPVLGWTGGTLAGAASLSNAGGIVQCLGDCSVWNVYCYYYPSGKGTKECAVYGTFGSCREPAFCLCSSVTAF